MFRKAIETPLSVRPSSTSFKVVQDDGVQRFVNDDTSGVVRVHSDPYFLLNNLSPTSDGHLTDVWLESLTEHVDDNLMSQLPKDEVATFVKSRYIQSPSELKAHLLSLLERSDTLKMREEIKSKLDSLQSQKESEVKNDNSSKE